MHNWRGRVEFAQSARRHRIGRGRVVMAVATERGLLVIHAMDLRSKWRRYYEEGLR